MFTGQEIGQVYCPLPSFRCQVGIIRRIRAFFCMTDNIQPAAAARCLCQNSQYQHKNRNTHIRDFIEVYDWIMVSSAVFLQVCVRFFLFQKEEISHILNMFPVGPVCIFTGVCFTCQISERLAVYPDFTGIPIRDLLPG
jgi:hypothetical protein